jgi:hypothetical protein
MVTLTSSPGLARDTATPLSGTNDTNVATRDPTAMWRPQVGVRRRTAYAGRRERVFAAEARGAERGAAEQSDSPSDETMDTMDPSSSTSKSVSAALSVKTNHKSAFVPVGKHSHTSSQKGLKSQAASSSLTNDEENMPTRKREYEWSKYSYVEERAAKAEMALRILEEEDEELARKEGQHHTSAAASHIDPQPPMSTKVGQPRPPRSSNHVDTTANKPETERKQDFVPPQPPLRQRPVSLPTLLQPLEYQRPQQQQQNCEVEKMPPTMSHATQTPHQQYLLQPSHSMGWKGDVSQPSSQGSIANPLQQKTHEPRPTQRPCYQAQGRTNQFQLQPSPSSSKEIDASASSSTGPEETSKEKNPHKRPRLALNSPLGRQQLEWSNSEKSDRYSSLLHGDSFLIQEKEYRSNHLSLRDKREELGSHSKVCTFWRICRLPLYFWNTFCSHFLVLSTISL